MKIDILILKKSIYILLIYSISLFSNDLKAQQHNQFYDKFTTKDGLPSDCVTSLMQDSKGYLWIGTTNGLAKYDGNKFTTFEQTNDTNSIGGHKILDIFEDEQGIIWVGSAVLNRYDRENNSWKRYTGLTKNNNIVSYESVSSIAQENDSIIWFLTLNGLNKLNKYSEKIDSYLLSNNVKRPNSKIINISPGKQITIVPKTGFDVFNFDIKSKKFTKLPFNLKSFENGTINKRIEIQSDKEYIGLLQKTENLENTYLFNYSTQQNSINIITEFKTKLFNRNIFKIDDEIILLSSNYVKIFNEKLELINSKYLGTRLTANTDIYCLHKERNNTIWIGTLFGLICIYPNNAFHFLNSANGLSNEYIRSILIDSQEQILIGTKGGGSYKANFTVHNNIERKLSVKDIIYSPNIQGLSATNKIIELTNKNILFITTSRLYLYDTKSDVIVNSFFVEYSSSYWSATEISDGIVVGGLYYPALTKFKITNNSIRVDTTVGTVGSSISSYAMYRDAENQVWIGGQGLFKMNYNKDTKEFKFENYLSFNDPVNKNKNPVWGILDLNKDTLLVGTTENGLFFLDKKTKSYKHYTTEDGLSSDVISGLLKDKKGNIWISTINGLNVFSKKEKKFISFFERDGLLSNDFNFKACDQNSAGWMFFGTKKGVVYFHPDSILYKNYAHHLYINEFKILDEVLKRELENGDKIILNHKQNFFTLEFSLLDFRNPKGVDYEYVLEGYDNEIRVTDGKNPRASYTNVPPGKYIFKLKAFNEKDFTVKNQIEIPITIEPAFYQTFLFKLFIILIIVLVISAIIYQYIKRQFLSGKLYKLELDLLRSQMNPHFIFNIMSAIQGIVMKNEKMQAVDYLAKFARLMRMNLDYSLLEHTSVDKTIQFLETYVNLESLNLNEPIDFNINIDDAIDKDEYHVSPMLIQPFIENAIIHGLASRNKDMRLNISMKKEDKFILCTIKDNGIGRIESYKLNEAKRKGHESVGIKITKRRNLLQLKKYKFKEDSIEIIDLYDKNGNATGTEVNLKITYILNR